MIFYFCVIPKVLQFFPKKRDMKLVEFTPPKNQKQKKQNKNKKKTTDNFLSLGLHKPSLDEFIFLNYTRVFACAQFPLHKLWRHKIDSDGWII